MIQRLNAIGEEKPYMLLYITAIVNGRPVSGATHNFITPTKTKECGIKVEAYTTSVMKAANSAA